jgi:hypothetical protein
VIHADPRCYRVCVEILCAVEPIIRIELPEKVVKAGGYGSMDNAIKTSSAHRKRNGRYRKY